MRRKTIIITGSQNSGKTTFVVKLVRALARRGIRVGTIKHASHGFHLDKKGKDSCRHFNAGARSAMVVSRDGFALFQRGTYRRPSIPAIVRRYFPDADLVIIEGFKFEPLPVFEVYRSGIPLYVKFGLEPAALISDSPPPDWKGPLFRRNDVAGVIRFIKRIVASPLFRGRHQ